MKIWLRPLPYQDRLAGQVGGERPRTNAEPSADNRFPATPGLQPVLPMTFGHEVSHSKIPSIYEREEIIVLLDGRQRW